jgi:hypothetical protein
LHCRKNTEHKYFLFSRGLTAGTQFSAQGETRPGLMLIQSRRAVGVFFHAFGQSFTKEIARAAGVFTEEFARVK